MPSDKIVLILILATTIFLGLFILIHGRIDYRTGVLGVVSKYIKILNRKIHFKSGEKS